MLDREALDSAFFFNAPGQHDLYSAERTLITSLSAYVPELVLLIICVTLGNGPHQSGFHVLIHQVKVLDKVISKVLPTLLSFPGFSDSGHVVDADLINFLSHSHKTQWNVFPHDLGEGDACVCLSDFGEV